MLKPAPMPVRVWDLPTRLFHWSLVILIICSWASFEFSGLVGDTTLLWHRLNGYAILILLIWRVLWGLFGSPSARFSNFLTWPWTAAAYGFDLIRGRDRRSLGHNPLGAYMILVLIAAVATQGTLGLMATEHNYVTWGPLSALAGSDERSIELAKWHVWIFDNVLLGLIALHISVNVLYRIIKKDRLIEAMVTGTKPPGTYDDENRVANAELERPLLRAMICLVIATAIFAGAIKTLGGKLFYI
jgi:cytochrome b